MVKQKMMKTMKVVITLSLGMIFAFSLYSKAALLQNLDVSQTPCKYITKEVNEEKPQESPEQKVALLQNLDVPQSHSKNITKEVIDEKPQQSLEQLMHMENMSASMITFEQYKMRHSHQALLREYVDQSASLSDRKFAIAYYWCPQRLGNILHTFFNTIVWSMIHNRTVLWQYHDSPNVGTESQCQDVLKISSWLPSYDVWKDRLDLQGEAVPVWLDTTDWRESHHPKFVLYPQIGDILTDKKENVSRVSWNSDASHSMFRDYLRQLPTEFLETANSLYSEGKGFLFGMLYYSIFSLQTPVEKTVFANEYYDNQTSKVFSIALHSRHTVGDDDGSYIVDEVKCLKKFLPHVGDANCEVHIMSDRNKTVDLLIQWVLKHNCSAVIANHNEMPRVRDIAEHGPWSGSGYLVDLEVTGAARSGFIGDRCRSSSILIANSMEYKRRMIALKKGKKLDKSHPLKICDLPRRSQSGYNYGPGTPTFRHHRFKNATKTTKN